jgi:hypothetical protein
MQTKSFSKMLQNCKHIGISFWKMSYFGALRALEMNVSAKLRISAFKLLCKSNRRYVLDNLERFITSLGKDEECIEQILRLVSSDVSNRDMDVDFEISGETVLEVQRLLQEAQREGLIIALISLLVVLHNHCSESQRKRVTVTLFDSLSSRSSHPSPLVRMKVFEAMSSLPHPEEIQGSILVQALGKVSLFGKSKTQRITLSESEKSLLEVESVSPHLIGTLTFGLEDEISEVRIAALKAVAHFALVSEIFAKKCLDIVVDMFVDDSNDVQISAVETIGTILSQWKFGVTTDYIQLKSLLNLLKSQNPQIKKAAIVTVEQCIFAFPNILLLVLQDLFSIAISNVNLKNSDCWILRMFQRIALNNKITIFMCSKEICQLAFRLILADSKLSSLHLVDVQNPVYIALLCLLWNASSGRLDLFSEYLPKLYYIHESFLRSQAGSVFLLEG